MSELYDRTDFDYIRARDKFYIHETTHLAAILEY